MLPGAILDLLEAGGELPADAAVFGFHAGHATAPGGQDHLTVPVELIAARNGPSALAG